MKIIRLTTLLDFGGQERKYISFTQEPSLLKNDYIFAAIGYGGNAEKIIRDRGFEVVIFDKNPSIGNLKNILMLYKWFKQTKPDIVHTAAAEANFHGTIAAKLAGIPVIIAEEIGLPLHSNKAKLIFRFVYKLCDKVICVSQAVKSFLISIKEIEHDKGVVIYNPVGKSKNITKINPTDFTIVCVGRLEKVKNQQLLISAFSKLNSPKAQLILVGDGRERVSLEKMIKNLGLQNNVTITGFSPEPQEYLAKANLFVLPSLTEGFGIAVVEAMQQGLACLCSKIGGIPEFIHENKTGWLFDPSNEEELITKLTNISKMSKSELDLIGENAKQFVLKNFSEKKYVTELENFYKTCHD